MSTELEAPTLGRKHEKLEVWRLSMELVIRIYRLTNSFPVDERYGLSQQVRRAAVSIPSNIAEGSARESLKDYLRFLSIARGSLVELETQLQIASRLGYNGDFNTILKQTNQIFAGLANLIKSLKRIV